MRVIETATPVFTLVLVALLALLPWGLPAESYPFTRYVTPLLPYMVIHYWTVRSPSAMPSAIVFIVGLLIDIMTRGPLGFWSLIYLIGTAIVRLTRGFADRGHLTRWIGYIGAAGVLTAATWALASSYYLRVIDPLPILWASIVTAIAYPLLALLLGSILPVRRAASNPSLTRGA